MMREQQEEEAGPDWDEEQAQKAEPMTQFAPGAAVTWLSVPHGGYGYVWPVDGTVVRTTRTRVTIRVRKRSGEDVERTVRPQSLRLRPQQ